MEQIERLIHDNKEYLQWLIHIKISSNAAIVDTWYYETLNTVFNKLRQKMMDTLFLQQIYHLKSLLHD